MIKQTAWLRIGALGYLQASGPHLLFFHLAIVLHPIFSQEVLYGAVILSKSIPAVRDAFLQQYQDTLQARRVLQLELDIMRSWDDKL